MTGGSAVLATYGLEKRYGARPALTGLDLRVPRGVVYGFLRPKGASKTEFAGVMLLDPLAALLLTAAYLVGALLVAVAVVERAQIAS
jgi:ABC-2 type transport system ATP-binding protein